MSLYKTSRHFEPKSDTRNTDYKKHQLIRAMHEKQSAAREREDTILKRQATQQNHNPNQKITLKNPRWIHINENNRATREFKTKFGDKILLRIDQENADGKTINFKIHDNNMPVNIDPSQLVTTISTKANGPTVDIELEVKDPRSKNNKNREMDVYFIANCDDAYSVHCEIPISDILKAHIVEIEDTLFNHNSTMLRPCGITKEAPDDNYPSSNKEQDTISGLEVIKATYEFLYYENENRRPKKILLMGHSDPSGNEEYNKKISSLRAKTIQYLLIGEEKKNDWIEQFKEDKKDGVRTYCNRDIQEIVNWARSLPFEKDNKSSSQPFNYSPITVDGIFGPKSKEALKGFQNGYNKVFNKNITVDGVTGKQVAEAIFDVYQWELNRILTNNFTKEYSEDKTPSIKELKSLLKWGNPENSTEKAILSCGENWPLNETSHPSSKNYRSLKDRRVEILLLDEGAESQTELCTPETCSRENCPVYNGDYINKEYLEVNPTLEEFPFRFLVYHNNDTVKNVEYNMLINQEGRKPVILKGKIREEDNGQINTMVPLKSTTGTLEVFIDNKITLKIPLKFKQLTLFGESEDKDRQAAEERLVSLGYYFPKHKNKEPEENDSNNTKDDDTFNLALLRFKDDNNLFLDTELNVETITKMQNIYGS